MLKQNELLTPEYIMYDCRTGYINVKSYTQRDLSNRDLSRRDLAL